MLKNLIHSSEINPFNQWPNLSISHTINELYTRAILGEDTHETFSVSRDGILAIYLQFQKMDWDSNHFGFRCERLCNLYINNELNIDDLESILIDLRPKIQKYILQNKISFIYSDIPSVSKFANFFIQNLGFKFILNWLDGFLDSKQIKNMAQSPSVGPMLPSELDYIVKISEENYYKGGRFYLDNNFEKTKIDSMYGALIKNSIANNDIVLVYREKGNPIGAFICNSVKYYPLLSDLKVAGLRFLIVDPKQRGKKIGLELFIATLNYLKGKSDIITTGLESHNLVSLGLHMKLDFKFNYSHNAYHLWV